MNAHIRHLHLQAQLADLAGHHILAGTIRSMAVAALLELRGPEFFASLLPMAEHG